MTKVSDTFLLLTHPFAGKLQRDEEIEKFCVDENKRTNLTTHGF